MATDRFLAIYSLVLADVGARAVRSSLRSLPVGSADLAAGRLMRPFDLDLKSRWSYYVVYPESVLRHQKIRAFRDWLFDEVAICL